MTEYILLAIIIFVTIQSVYHYYMWKRTEQALKSEMKHCFEVRFNHIKYVRQKLKTLKILGIRFPLEEKSLKHYEKIVLESYERHYEFINDEKIKIPT